ncbi:shikimate dehydrogenase [Clostridium sp. ATCC 25772]|uniref:shikimate dehydrogenase n=1 Tax=Clostridium sp. ATCC 25772 TaxID=1676991 RepID=UPI0007862173|nr:shikimate dehydrogenase [Clostridium sp. ATCC 25772]
MYSGLLGKNIKYSLSPLIHNEKYKEDNIPLEYKIFDVDENNLDIFINKAKKELIGFNVTIPYKESIIKYLDSIEYPANKIGAVNTVVNVNSKLIGYNTDYFGFISSLEKENIKLEGKNALIIGSGGAAKAIIYALRDLKIKSIDIALRNEKSIREHKAYISKTINIHEEFDLTEYDIVINCTPISGANHPNETPINIKKCNSKKIFYDLNYEPQNTLFMKIGEEYGCRVLNGYSMLLHQGYKAIKIWKKYLKENT